MPDQDTKRRQIKTTNTVFGIIEALKHLDGATVTEIADFLGMANSTIYDHLTTLESKRYVIRRGNEYDIGVRFLNYGMYARSKKKMWQPTEPLLERLSNETQEGARAWIEEHGRTILIGRSFGEQAIELPPFDRPGSMGFMHCHAGGKAILAYLPEDRVEEIIDRYGLPKQTENTITNREALFEELEEIRNKKVVFDNSEVINDIRSIAAPILVDDTVLGSISIAAPVSRMQGEYYHEDLPHLLLSAVEEIQLQLIEKFELEQFN